jgi:hypothetical protein
MRSPHFHITHTSIRPTSVQLAHAEISKELGLSQDYPNPYNPATAIEFALPKPSYISLKVFDMLGKEVAALVSQELRAGYFTVRWEADVSSGKYLYRLRAGEFIDTRKKILLQSSSLWHLCSGNQISIYKAN